MSARIYVLHHVNPKITVRKCADRWQVSCPCGFEWRTRWHRLALILATGHEHRAAA